MESRVFDASPMGGGVRRFFFDDAENKYHVEHKVDLQAHIDFTRELYKESPDNMQGEMLPVASIPTVLWPELEKKGIMTRGGRIMDDQKMKAWLNDPDNRAFRTRPGWV